MIYYRTEYRIVKAKNGCEVYRNECAGKVGEKLDQLILDHPGTEYKTQRREVRLEMGCAVRDHLGRPQWGPWS